MPLSKGRTRLHVAPMQTVPRYNTAITPNVIFQQVTSLAFYASGGNYTGFSVGESAPALSGFAQ